MMATATEGQDSRGWRSEFYSVAVRQGPSFIVLLLILYGIWSFGDYAIKTGIPAHLDKIQDGYEQLQTKQSKDLERVCSTFESDRKESRELQKETQRDFREAIDTLREQSAQLRASRAP